MNRRSRVPSSRSTRRGVAEELRAGVEARLGELTDAQWNDMIELDLVDPDAPYSEHEVEAIMEMTERRFEVWGSRPTPRVIPPRTQDETRSLYGDAQSWFAGKYAPPLGVRRFRETVLDGQILEPEGALPRLTRMVEDGADGRDLPARYSVLVSSPVPRLTEMWADPILEFLAPIEGLTYWVPVVANTDSNWLRLISVSLAGDMGWSKAEAALWIVTGIAPKMDMIRTVFHPSPRYNPFGERFEMSINPATPPREVMKVYADARGEVVGRRTRLQTPKHLQLAVFADERPVHETWADSMRRWNLQFPKWRYPRKANSITDVTQFARDATTARRRFLAQRPLGKQVEET